MNEKVLAALTDIENRYMDKWGLIGTDWPSGIDGGDSSHKMSHLAIALYLNKMDADAVTSLAVIHKHGLVRHPDPDKWYSNPLTFSRDQFSPRVMAASFLGLVTAGKQYFKAHLKHLLLFAWNIWPSWNEPGPFAKYGTNYKLPDITLFENWGFYIRLFRFWPLYPLLLISDLETVINAIIKRFDSDIDINNTLAAATHATLIMPTGLGRLAVRIMRPVIEAKLKAYWAKERNEPPIDIIWIEGLKRQQLL